MKVNIRAINIELTSAISEYVNKKLSSIEKFLKDKEEISGFVEVGKTTRHHRQGDLFRSEFDINIGGENFYAESEKEDLYIAIDDAKEEIVQKITQNKNRRKTLFRRGAASVKKMMRGLSKRNPFTSKY
jgi:putative sigma-54 modulation protein